MPSPPGISILDGSRAQNLAIVMSKINALVPFGGEGMRLWGHGPMKQKSGQIIATSHDLTPKGGLVREISLFQGNLGW